MRFVKASERLPEKDGSYCIKNTTTGHVRGIWYRTIGKSMLRTRKDDWEWLDESDPVFPELPEKSLILTAFQNEPVTFLLSNALRHLTQDQQRQLCNALQERLPVPASIEQEAERQYPYNRVEKINEWHDAQIIDLKREVFCQTARQYMGEIEKLRAENSKMRNALEGLTEENNKLAAENHTQSEELGELKNITDGLDGRVINQQRDLLVAYRNKIALMPGITIETIMTMLEDDIKTLRTMDGAEMVKNIIDPSNDKS